MADDHLARLPGPQISRIHPADGAGTMPAVRVSRQNTRASGWMPDEKESRLMTGQSHRRLFGKVALDFPDHPKILPLSDSAFRCIIEAILWSRKQETDGFLPKRLAVAKWSLEVLRELCDNDPEKPSLSEREEGWYIHDFAAEQDTKAVIEARRDQAKEAGRRGGLARSKRTAKRTASEPLSETQAETETETETEVTTDVVTSVARKRAPRTKSTRISDGYMPPKTVVDAIRAETGASDDQLRRQHQKFIDYWLGTGKPMANWDATWRRWMRTAHERGELAGTVTPIRNGGTDAKGNQWITGTAQLDAQTRPALEAGA